MDQENQEKEPKCSEVVDSDFLDPKGPIRQKDIHEVQETIEGGWSQGYGFYFQQNGPR